MWNSWRQQEHLAFADRHLDRFPILLYLYFNIALELVEKLLALVPMVILPRIRPADDHHDEVVVIVNTLIPNRRLEQMPVLVYPLFEIKGTFNHSECYPKLCNAASLT